MLWAQEQFEIMWNPRDLILALVIGVVCIPQTAISQPASKPPDMMGTLNREAQASDSVGIHAYSQDLVQMLVGTSTGPAYAASLSERLARAEFMARHGQRKLISEADIAQAFMALMREIGAPKSLVADISSVHSNRIAFQSSLPAMISQKDNGRYCNPGEAIFVLEMMIENVGRPLAQTPGSVPKAFVAAIKPPVRVRLEQFYANHSRSEVTEVFNHLFNVFQI